MAETLSLGSGDDRQVEPGSHTCFGHQNHDQLMETLLPFVATGLQCDECCAVMGDEALMDSVRRRLHERRLDPDAYAVREQLLFLTSLEHYCREPGTSPAHLLRAPEDPMQLAASRGFRQARNASDNTPLISHVMRSLRDWVLFEAQLNISLRGSNVVWLCAHAERDMPGELLTGMLKTHALVVMDGVIHENPLYWEPDRLSGTRPSRREVI